MRNSATAESGAKYDVVLSYAGEQRGYVEKVAAELTRRRIRPFYDKYETAALWGRDLYEHLEQIYQNEARYCVVFASEAYAIKAWPTHERRSAQARSIESRQEYILPVRFDETEIPGLSGNISYIDANATEPDEVADLIAQKLRPRSRGSRRRGEAYRQRLLSFENEAVSIICSELPPELWLPMDDPSLNLPLRKFADIDALLEVYGDVRAVNPHSQVRYTRASRMTSDDLVGHIVLLGGIGWNAAARRFFESARQIPIAQVEDPQLRTGGIFVVHDYRYGEPAKFFPEWRDGPQGPELASDVALVARLRSTYNVSKTLIFFNGIHGQGVLGAVRCLTDPRVRKTNEAFLTERFQDDEFALLVKVSIVGDEVVPPDLQNPSTRLYEWGSGVD